MNKFEIIYKGKPDFEMEKKIDKKMKELGYKNWASGYGCGRRDIQLERHLPLNR